MAIRRNPLQQLLDQVSASFQSLWERFQSLPPNVKIAMGVVSVVGIGALVMAGLYLKPKPTDTPLVPGITSTDSTGSIGSSKTAGGSSSKTASKGSSKSSGSSSPASPPPPPVIPGNPGGGSLTLNVTGVSIEVSPVSTALSPIVGCGQDYAFAGVISASGSGTVKYQWERSDGSIIPGSVIFTSSGQHTVIDAHHIAGTATGSEHLTITSPNSLVSNDASYTFVTATGC